MSDAEAAIPSDAAAVGGGFGPALDALLAALPPDDALALTLGAAAHWLDGPLLARLVDEPGDGAGRLAAILALRFVHRDADGRVRYHDAARAHLAARGRAEAPDRWQAAHGRAMGYFDALAAAEPDGRADWWYEALYHRLVADEPAGLRELHARFDRAVWEHRPGLAERVVAAGIEVRPDLSEAGRWRVRLLAAELARHLGRGDGGRAELATLAAEAPEARVCAEASIALGEAALAGSQWADAVAQLTAGRNVLRGAATTAAPDALALLSARATRGLGDVYLDLAARSGGLTSTSQAPSTAWLTRALDGLGRLPFLAYAWLVRHVAAMPAWWAWFPDADYQDWIVAELMRVAQGHYVAAERALGDRDRRAVVGLRAAMARLDRQRHRGRRAMMALDRLLAEPEVADSPYWRAQLDLERSRAAMLLGDAGPAPESLLAARDTLQRFRDAAGAGAASRTLGDLAAAGHRADEAAEHWLAAAAAYGASGDVLSRTEVVGALERLAAGASRLGRPGEAHRARIAQASAALTERAYVARFPNRLLERFRRIALVLALPPAMAFGTLALLALVPLIVIVEGETRLLAAGMAGGTRVRDYAILAAAAILPLLLAIWVFRAVFGLLGMVAVRRIGQDISALERAEPAVITTGPDGLTRHVGDGALSLAWPAVARQVDIELRMITLPFAMFSRTVIEGASGLAIALDGITSGFGDLRTDLARHLGARSEAVRRSAVRVALLSPRWVLGVVAASCAIAVATTARGGLVAGYTEVLEGAEAAGQAGASLELPLTGLAVILLPTLLLLFMAVTHLRLVAFERRARRTVGAAGGLLPRGLLALATTFWVLVSAAWLFFLAARTLG